MSGVWNSHMGLTDPCQIKHSVFLALRNQNPATFVENRVYPWASETFLSSNGKTSRHSTICKSYEKFLKFKACNESIGRSCRCLPCRRFLELSWLFVENFTAFPAAWLGPHLLVSRNVDTHSKRNFGRGANCKIQLSSSSRAASLSRCPRVHQRRYENIEARKERRDSKPQLRLPA